MSGQYSQNVLLPSRLFHVANGQLADPGEISGMQKVPSLLRSDNGNQDYDPLVVSLGPYHHGKTELQAAEDFKLKVLETFVKNTQKDVLFYFNNVLELVNDARNCYIEDFVRAFDDRTFAEMMLLDACFIIHIILSMESYSHFDITQSFLGDLVSAMAIRDIFLLENQIPFWVLKLVICLGYDEGEKLLKDFLNVMLFEEVKRTIPISEDKRRPFHLLDACWLILIGNNAFGKYGNNLRTRRRVLGRDRKDDNVHHKPMKYHYSFRSVTDLKLKGIHFKPSCADSLMSIRFKSGCFFAQVEVPIWYVSIYTKVFFMNMVAYELCPSTCTDGEFTAYIDFMKSLINSAKDVKELREKKVLRTSLGSDEEVAMVYKEINTYGMEKLTIYPNVKKRIEGHYNNRGKTWLAELHHAYLSSPWNAIALLAATFLLVLTFLQTYFTISG